MGEHVKEQGLVVVKENFITKITKSVRKLFFSEKNKSLPYKANYKNRYKTILIKEDTEPVEEYILNARKAYRKFAINNKSKIADDIFLLIEEKIKENESKLRKLIELNKEEISYEDIIEELESKEKETSEFKLKDENTSRFKLPIGVIGVECIDAKNSIKNIFKAISTRNAIIILRDRYNKYSIESLILLIVKECLKRFYVDDNIIQIFDKDEIKVEHFDKVIRNDGKVDDKMLSDIIYLYQESEEQKENVKEEYERLESLDEFKSYKVEVIKGEFRNIINYLNNNRAVAVCMYTDNKQKAYKFINWINSPNLFVNTGIQKVDTDEKIDNEFFNSKYVLHKDVF